MDLKDHSYKDVINTLVRDMVSIVANEDSVTSWLIQNEPIWLCNPDEECKHERSSSSSNYIAKSFLEHELEPHGWHDILATLDVCANVHATKHCNDEGSMNMVRFVLMEEVDEIIPD